MKIVLTHQAPPEERATAVSVIANGRSWTKYRDMEATQESEPQHRQTKLGAMVPYVSLLYPLLDRFHPMGVVTLLPPVKEKGRTLRRLLVRVSGGGEIELHFDEHSSLLAKRVWRLPPGPGVTGEVVDWLRDYKTIDGVRWPMTRLTVNQKTKIETRFHYLKMLSTIDERMFMRP